jgi:hypothetical protein
MQSNDKKTKFFPFRYLATQDQGYVALMVGWLMNVEQLVERELSSETKLLGENLSHCHFVHHKV